MPGSSPGMTAKDVTSHALRPHRHRLRPRRLFLRHPRGAARHESSRGGEGQDLRRHLPQYRLHSLKALLHASELYEESGHLFDKMGIKVGRPKLDLAAMMKFKDEGVDGNVKGVAFLFKKNKIDTFQGAGRIAAPGKVEVKAADGKTE